MKNIRRGAAIVGAIFVLSGCVAGPVSDKRAPGMPGEKTFQILVDDKHLISPGRVWVRVPERVWDRCDLDDPYPSCVG